MLNVALNYHAFLGSSNRIMKTATLYVQGLSIRDRKSYFNYCNQLWQMQFVHPYLQEPVTFCPPTERLKLFVIKTIYSIIHLQKKCLLPIAEGLLSLNIMCMCVRLCVRVVCVCERMMMCGKTALQNCDISQEKRRKVINESVFVKINQ